MYPKLWEASGVSYSKLLDELIRLALEAHEEKPGSPTEFPIVINSAGGTVELRWHVVEQPEIRYTLVTTNAETHLVSTHRLKDDGAIVLTQQELSGMKLRVERRLVPTDFALRQNYPNPFNPMTVIRYELPSDEHVSLIVYDILGKEIATLINSDQEAGYYEVPFAADRFASGVYFYRLTAGSFTSIQKMLLLK